MQTTPRNSSFVDFEHAGTANLAKVGFAHEGLRLLRMVAKSVGLTFDVRIDSPCWRRNSTGLSAPSSTFKYASDIPALW
jgi:hypothetical protein